MGEQSQEPCRILLADDDQDVRTTLKLVLDMDHHSVEEAGDGLEALELFHSQRFDLVITDYLMPRMSGDQLAGEIKKQTPSLPVIMITANADLLPDPVPGVDFLLPKPFQIAELRRAIRTMVERNVPYPADETQAAS
jgi:CheY-like chemotaxis protein